MTFDKIVKSFDKILKQCDIRITELANAEDGLIDKKMAINEQLKNVQTEKTQVVDFESRVKELIGRG